MAVTAGKNRCESKCALVRMPLSACRCLQFGELRQTTQKPPQCLRASFSQEANSSWSISNCPDR
jgi:hypothetical protein